MKKHSIITISVLVGLMVGGCSGPSVTSSSSLSSSSSATSSSTLPTSSSTSSSSSSVASSSITSSSSSGSTTSVASSSSVASILTTTKLSFLSNSSYYGNTNGNANNQGLVVYDHTHNLHYYAIGASVYQYDPALDETSLLFTHSGGGYVRNLCLVDDSLYYVETQNNYLQKYQLDTEVITTLYERDTSYVSRYGNYVFADMNKLDYSSEEIQGLGIYRHDTESFLTNFSSGATNVNISGTKLMYTTNDGPMIQLMADTFSGKTTLKSFVEQGIEEIHDLLLLSEGYSSPYPRVFAMLASTSTQTNLYVYQTDTDALTLIASGIGIHSINTDGANLYFINNQELYRYEVGSATLSKMRNLYQDSRYLYMMNHWLYFSNDTLSTLYRIHPDTEEIESEFWLS